MNRIKRIFTIGLIGFAFAGAMSLTSGTVFGEAKGTIGMNLEELREYADKLEAKNKKLRNRIKQLEKKTQRTRALLIDSKIKECRN